MVTLHRTVSYGSGLTRKSRLQPSTTMFKGILPSKRISSSEFTMITPLGDSNVNGKENQAGSIDTQPLPGPTKNVRPLAKGFPQSFDKRKRSAGKAADLGVAVGMNQNEAFDKLLVRMVHFLTLNFEVLICDSIR